jgi:hypothetical protein
MEQDWRRAGTELSLEEMMADPMVHLVMRRDGLTPDDVRTVFEEVRERQRLRLQTNAVSRTTVAVDKENHNVLQSPL